MSEQPRAAADPGAIWQVLTGGLDHGTTLDLPVLTGSMAPLIPAGSVITVTGLVPDAVLVEGDVVVFRAGTRLVAHRLLFCCPLPEPGWFVQRGDGVSRAGIIARHAILGRVVAVQPPHGPPHDLTTPAARHQARRTARRVLYRLLKGGWWRDRRREQA